MQHHPLYCKKTYFCGLNEEVSIVPNSVLRSCEFSVEPPLPEGIVLDKETGVIHGKVSQIIGEKTYTIICKNNKIKKTSHISLEFDKFDMNGSCEVYIKTLTGKTFMVKTDLDCSVKSLKRKIEILKEIPLDQQRLIFSGKQLEGKKLCDYGVEAGSELHLILRLRG